LKPGIRTAARLAGAAGALIFACVSGAGAAGPVDTLQLHVQGLHARARHALLDLYALDSRLQAAQQHLSALQSQAASLQHEDQLLSQQLSSTRRTLSVSRRQLAINLQVLYKQGDVSPLAVVLGAQSLNDAVTKLDALSQLTHQSKQIVAVTTSAKTRLTTLRQTLRARRAQLEADVAAARRTAATLTSARSRRLAFIGELRTKARLEQQQIDALQRVAQQVEQKSNMIQVAATQSEPVALAPAGGRTLVVSSTGYSLPGHTSTGIPVGFGVVAVDPSVIPLGTRITIPGYGDGVAADTGGGVRGADIDLWFPTPAAARAWGRRTVQITLH
jgi:3D (Asp-Asp-Asp) domain-containing protein/predicted  nucleic acid-binding Zn-ribbon protein